MIRSFLFNIEMPLTIKKYFENESYFSEVICFDCSESLKLSISIF